MLVVELLASLTDLAEQPSNRVLTNLQSAASCPDRHSFAKKPYDFGSLGSAQLVHIDSLYHTSKHKFSPELVAILILVNLVVHYYGE